MKHYVTILRKQKLTYSIDAENKRDAREYALQICESEEIPYDVSDAEFEIADCITYSEFLEYLRKEKNN